MRILVLLSLHINHRGPTTYRNDSRRNIPAECTKFIGSSGMSQSRQFQGTAFFAGSSTYFNDTEVRNGILKTAEIAGHTIKMGNMRHYLLADVALVGEAIMLAMRTNIRK